MNQEINTNQTPRLELTTLPMREAIAAEIKRQAARRVSAARASSPSGVDAVRRPQRETIMQRRARASEIESRLGRQAAREQREGTRTWPRAVAFIRSASGEPPAIEAQFNAILAYARREQLHLSQVIVGVGSSDSRAWTRACRERADMIVCANLARISRKHPDVLRRIAQADEKGLQVITLDQGPVEAWLIPMAMGS